MKTPKDCKADMSILVVDQEDSEGFVAVDSDEVDVCVCMCKCLGVDGFK